jgi:hypothetical protein
MTNKKEINKWPKYVFLLSVIFVICLFIIGPNMMIGIFAVMIWGIIVGVIPMFLFFEIYHFARRKSYISYPFVKGIIAGSVMGTIGLYFLQKDSHGESGLAFVAFSPFLLIGFIVVGILVAWFYKWWSKPLFFFRDKKRQKEGNP